MGVFARIFRRSRTTEEGRSAAAEATQAVDDAGAGATDEVKDAGAAEAEGKPEDMPEGAAEAPADSGGGIPEQQSVEAAADSEADEGART